MRIGVLTGGGDAPGLNAAIRAITRQALSYGWEAVGIRHGWGGLLEKDVLPLSRASVRGVLAAGGTLLGTTRTNPYKRAHGAATVKRNMQVLGLDALIAIGGDDTLGVAAKLHGEGVAVVGVPKTIDNDLGATDVCIGFDTAVGEVTRAVDRLRPTAEAHDRIMLVEVMGRTAGWIALYGGLAGGADIVLIPEFPFSVEEVCSRLRSRHAVAEGRASIIVVAEGAQPSDLPGSVIQDDRVDEFGHVRLGGIGQLLAKEIESRTRFEARVTVLGHTQRGGSPSAADRILATRLGIAAVEQVRARSFGTMVALRGNAIVAVSLDEATRSVRLVPAALYEMAKVFW